VANPGSKKRGNTEAIWRGQSGIGSRRCACLWSLKISENCTCQPLIKLVVCLNFVKKDDGLITKFAFFYKQDIVFYFPLAFYFTSKDTTAARLPMNVSAVKQDTPRMLKKWKRQRFPLAQRNFGVVGKWFNKDIGFICYSSKYSGKHRNLLLLLCLCQTSCDMSTYFKLEDVRFCYFVFHRPQLHHVGDGTA